MEMPAYSTPNKIKTMEMPAYSTPNKIKPMEMPAYSTPNKITTTEMPAYSVLTTTQSSILTTTQSEAATSRGGIMGESGECARCVYSISFTAVKGVNESVRIYLDLI